METAAQSFFLSSLISAFILIFFFLAWQKQGEYEYYNLSIVTYATIDHLLYIVIYRFPCHHWLSVLIWTFCCFFFVIYASCALNSVKVLPELLQLFSRILEETTNLQLKIAPRNCRRWPKTYVLKGLISFPGSDVPPFFVLFYLCYLFLLGTGWTLTVECSGGRAGWFDSWLPQPHPIVDIL